MTDNKENPDRSRHYKLKGDGSLVVVNTMTGNEQSLVEQVNENFRQMRLLKTALDDRDEVIGELHGSIKRRDEVIAAQEKKAKLFNRVRPFVYAFFGGALTALGDVVIHQLFRH